MVVLCLHVLYFGATLALGRWPAQINIDSVDPPSAFDAWSFTTLVLLFCGAFWGLIANGVTLLVLLAAKRFRAGAWIAGVAVASWMVLVVVAAFDPLGAVKWLG